LAAGLTGTSFGFSAVAFGGASEVARLASLATVGCAATAGGESGLGAFPATGVAGVDAAGAGELVGPVAGAGAAEPGVPEAGLGDPGAGDGGVVVESAGCDPTAAVGFAASGVLVVPGDDGAGVPESGASEVCVAAGALFVPEISQPSP